MLKLLIFLLASTAIARTQTKPTVYVDYANHSGIFGAYNTPYEISAMQHECGKRIELVSTPQQATYRVVVGITGLEVFKGDERVAHSRAAMRPGHIICKALK